MFHRHSASSYFRGFLQLLFPRLCEGCRQTLGAAEEVVCLACEVMLPRTSYHELPENETALRLAGRFPFVHASSFAYFTYEGLFQHLIHGLKYKGKKQNGVFLGKELGKALKQARWRPDGVIPVPIHKKRAAARGYNQSDYIAEGLGAALKIPVYYEAIIRNRYTESQTDKSREERIRNVSSAFTVVRPEILAGKHILLTDDVLTTGATLESCAVTLLSVPGVKISVATLGIAI